MPEDRGQSLVSKFRGMKIEIGRGCWTRDCSLSADLCPLLLLFYIVDRNATGLWRRLPCVVRLQRCGRWTRNRGVIGQAGKTKMKC